MLQLEWWAAIQKGYTSLLEHGTWGKVLSDFGMETCQPKSTPMNPKQVLNRRPDEEPPDEEIKARFATAIGSLMYMIIGTRPDIAFALGKLSRFTSQPQSHHQVALQRLLRYVKATQYHRVTYRSDQLIGCTDANFGGSVVTDGATRYPATYSNLRVRRFPGRPRDRGK